MKLSKDLISSLVYIHYTNRSVDYLTADKLKSLGLIESKPNKEVLTSLGIELLNNMDTHKLLNSLSKYHSLLIWQLYLIIFIPTFLSCAISLDLSNEA